MSLCMIIIVSKTNDNNNKLIQKPSPSMGLELAQKGPTSVKSLLCYLCTYSATGYTIPLSKIWHIRYNNTFGRLGGFFRHFQLRGIDTHENFVPIMNLQFTTNLNMFNLFMAQLSSCSLKGKHRQNWAEKWENSVICKKGHLIKKKL